MFSCVVSSHVPLSEKKRLLDLMLSRIQFNFVPGVGGGGVLNIKAVMGSGEAPP